MSEGERVCDCGRPCTRGRYGYFQSTCGRDECKTTVKHTVFEVWPQTKRPRRRLKPTSERTLENDFRPGTGGSK